MKVESRSYMTSHTARLIPSPILLHPASEVLTRANKQEKNVQTNEIEVKQHVFLRNIM